MSPTARRSLRGVLTRNMIVMQAIVVLAFVLAASIPIVNLMSGEQRLDGSVVEVIAAAIHRGPDGALTVTETGDLSELYAGYPNFWFFATDGQGHRVSGGIVPIESSALADNLSRIDSANVADVGSPETPVAIIRQHGSAAGRLWIITGGGPPYYTVAILFNAILSPVFGIFILLLSSASLLVIPHFVKRQLKGLDDLSAEADEIDVKQRGTRLSPDQVPSELQPLLRAVNAAFQRLDDGIDRQHRFMADAAHELRTPIAILQVNLEMLPETADKQRLLVNVARLSSMTDQLLDLQRMGLTSAPFQRLDLVELAATVTADVAPLATAAGDEICFQTGADAVHVMGDRDALSRALANLIQNAIMHGGDKARIRVEVCPDGRLQVADSGPGIDQADREEIFEPFHRVVPRQHGAGLGLSIVTDIVRHHHGTLTLADAPEGGALFEISLPLAP
ncbi:two-component sensor histidine kinase [Devosia yakushimensis]|uniref:histidine kinase n=1 Tax=Devosia yakushimensis TaxID=470028 RepID=A0ABQ5UMT2_9HYPH|nr:HAMP domain-containing sensor histidine kinase [Devosia yakushimensis]GLQ12041.1 two-component sensor histidine kinase [Devosia yakushimensis]